MIRIASAPDNIRHIQSLVDDAFAQYKICRSLYADILTALTEAVNNAIIHGNGEDETKYVHIDIRCQHSKIVFTIADEGKGFDPQSLPDPTLLENLECCGGRGVFLINQLSHAVRYLNNGNTVEIVFNLRS